VKENYERELENPNTWDFERAETKEPVKPSRVVVSVSFRNEDFSIVSEYAKRHGLKISEFIREAAIKEANGVSSNTLIFAFGSNGIQWSTNSLPNTTRVQTSAVEQDSKGVVTY
jgi:hypothetical protein